jgi:hypothetical protein
MPEEGPDHSENGDDLVGVEPFSGAVGGPLLFRLEFHRLPVQGDKDFPGRPGA